MVVVVVVMVVGTTDPKYRVEAKAVTLSVKHESQASEKEEEEGLVVVK